MTTSNEKAKYLVTQLRTRDRTQPGIFALNPFKPAILLAPPRAIRHRRGLIFAKVVFCPGYPHLVDTIVGHDVRAKDVVFEDYPSDEEFLAITFNF